MELTSSADEVLVCQTCGDKGFPNTFIYCVKCLEFAIHRYCLDLLPETSDELVIWFCEDCKPAGPYKLTILKDEPLQTQIENPTNSALVKTTCPKKKRQKKRITKKRKIVPLVAREDKVGCLEEATKPNCERVSLTNFPLKKVPLMSDPRRYVVLGLAKCVSQKQSPESGQLDNSSPLKTSVVPKPVKTTRKKKPKKKQKKKKKIIPLVAGKDMVSCPQEATELNHECVSPKISLQNEALVKLISEPNQICSPLEVNATRKRDATSLSEKTNKHKTQKTSDPVQHSSCDSSCSNVFIKDTEDMSHSVEDQGLEIKPIEGGHEKLLSDSSFSEKELKLKTEDNDGQVGTLNHMQNEQNMSVDRDGADATKSADFEINLQYIPYQPARPVLEPVWRGSFDITETDYDLFEGFVGHLSSKACYMVCDEATTLPSMLSLQMQPKTDLWPKSFLESQPSDANIALYFFPGYPKNERGFEQLVNDMIDEDLAMRATAKNAELLIFTSRVLPQSLWRFQGNYYLWGVFRRKRNDSPSPVNAVSNTSDICGLSEITRNELTDGKKILTRVKTSDSGSPQSPLCNYR